MGKKDKNATKKTAQPDPNAGMSLYNYMSQSSDTAGPGVTLQTQKGEKFLFGHVPEGTQRSIMGQKPKVNKLSGIYLTGPVSWSTLSGLGGFLLTLVGMGKENQDVRSCGDNVNWFCATWRHFLFHKPMVISTARMTQGHVTNEINIGGVLITPTEPRGCEEDEKLTFRNLQRLNNNTPWSNVDKTLETMFTSAKKKDGYSKSVLSTQTHTPLPAAKLDERSTCYIAQMHKKPGKFDPVAAKKLNIPPKRFKELVDGEPVTLDDGTVIQPDQCVGEPSHYGRILFLDIPDKRYVDGVINCPEWTRKYDSRIAQPVYGAGKKRDSSEMEEIEPVVGDNVPEPFVSTVYHFFGPEMESYFAGDASKYFDWMESLGPNVLHIMSAPWLDPHDIKFRGAASVCTKLRKIVGDQFPLHRKEYRTLSEPQSDFMADEALQKRFNMKLLAQGNFVCIQANKDVPPIVNDGLQEYDELDYPVEESEVDRPLRHDDGTLKCKAELLTLGTGSACPSKYRNVAGLLMRVPREDGSFTGVVMDCGEGTYGSLTRMYSEKGTLQIMREIKMLYISHLHADHHFGAPLFIEHWIKANPGKVLSVVGPSSFKRFLEECANFTPEMRTHVEFFACPSFLVTQYPNPVLPDVPGLTAIRTCYAQHCEQAYCAEFVFKLSEDEEFSFAYSGDTRPIEAFARMAHGCDLVIHEATLDNDLRSQAVAKKHCTFKEALDVCKSMEAKHVMLTHFSQRYPKLPKLADLTLEGKDGQKVPVGVAFDMMRMRLNEIADQADHFDAIGEALKDCAEEEDDDIPNVDM